MDRLVKLPALVIVATTVGLALLAASPATAPASIASRHASYDFDDNGRPDIAAGLPYWTESGKPAVGAVAIFPGGRLSTSPTVIDQTTSRVPGVSGSGDRFGGAETSDDFNGDGFADLAVGVPGDSPAGAVTVLSGSASGVITAGATEIRGPADAPGARFGAGLAAGDLDRDGYADLVVGAPLDADSGNPRGGSGSIRVFFGGRSGLDVDHPRTLGRPRPGDLEFGENVALGDFDGDGHLDVFENGTRSVPYSSELPTGQSAWCPGAVNGPTACRTLGTRSNPSPPVALAVGDITGDGRDDVVEGLVSYHRPSYRYAAGAILVRRGGGHGPRAGKVYSQKSPGVTGHSEWGDVFGFAVAVGDLDRDGHADIIVGSPGEDHGAGRIVIFRGDRRGLSTRHVRTLSQRDRGIPGSKAHEHLFGSELALARFAGDRDVDLLTATGNRSLFEVPGGRHGLVYRHARAYDLRRRLGHRPPHDTNDLALRAILGR